MQVEGDLAWQGSHIRVIRPNHWAEIMGAQTRAPDCNALAAKVPMLTRSTRVVRWLDMAAVLALVNSVRGMSIEHAAVRANLNAESEGFLLRVPPRLESWVSCRHH
jgi:hypothetical protein